MNDNNNAVIYKDSRQAIINILNHLVDQGWIKKVEGIYDEISALEEIIQPLFDKKDQELRDYFKYKTGQELDMNKETLKIPAKV